MKRPNYGGTDLLLYRCLICVKREARQRGEFGFQAVPRKGDIVYLPTEDGIASAQFVVDQVTHQPEGSSTPAATILFVGPVR